MARMLLASLQVLLAMVVFSACVDNGDMQTDGDVETDYSGEMDCTGDSERERTICIDVPIVDVVQTWPIIPTGQTKCFDNQREIVCPAEGGTFYGQDAHYPDRERVFTTYDVSGDTLVEDSLTGLIWTKTYVDNQTWLEARAYCDNLDYGDQTDWRLPNIHELRSLAFYGLENIASDFPGLPNENIILWSSTPDISPEYDEPWDRLAHGSFLLSSVACDPETKNWLLWITMGGHGSREISLSMSVLCVFSESEMPLSTTERFVAYQGDNSLMEDTTTGLVWVQSFEENTCWREALAYCENMDFGGCKDWRLPNINELASLINFGKYDPATSFPGDTFRGLNRFWSSTASGDSFEWYVNMKIGNIYWEKRTQNWQMTGYCSYSARCVRGGP